MADPIVEQIAQEIESRIENVTTANDFNQDLTVTRPARWGVGTITDGLAVLEQGQPEADTSVSETGIIAANPPACAWKQQFTITLFARPGDKDTTAAETYVNRMWADAVKAITRQGEIDADQWYTFGDLARNAIIDPPQMGVGQDQASAVIQFGVTVSYRTTENDPYTMR